jgi:hypothetical protein
MQDSEVALGTPRLLRLYQLKYSAKIVGVPVRTAKNIELSHLGVSGIPMTLSLKTQSHMEMK